MANVKYNNGSTSKIAKTGEGAFYGYTVNSHTSGTLQFFDGTTDGGTLMFNTVTYVATGTNAPVVVSFPQGISFYTGLYVKIGGAIDYTLLID